ncbi:type II toxin-antitoxin system PemK/MazF family toxin [Microbacterium sp. CJ88]|uniref:type II toxin-antitoxin system PemK/MazF family toxin n=1 Tax=Microbacterium sp. CJ88 TaxID=3445672 RepID=UPI003F65BA8F
MTPRSGLTGFLSRLLDAVSPARPRSTAAGSRTDAAASVSADAAGRSGATATSEVRPPGPRDLTITYAPERDGDPDAGEIVWTWVPYAENDGRGKDRPVLVIARQSTDRVYAVRLTSKAHDGDRDFLAIGTGPWDGQGRPSWVDIEQLYLVHGSGMRREAAALDRERFARIAQALQQRYGWSVER